MKCRAADGLDLQVVGKDLDPLQEVLYQHAAFAFTWLPPERGSEIGRFTFAEPQREEDVPVDFMWGFTLLIGQMWHVHDIRFIIGKGGTLFPRHFVPNLT